VYTTLNVQHVESLNDVVAGITGVVVRETVPDAVVDRADEIELIDLTPDELLQRLKEGKVYVPAQAERALQSFFTKGNLLALRELALRRTAERVDAQGLEWRRREGVAETWGTRERVLVAVGPAPSSADVIRAAYRLATRLRAPLLAVSVETPSFERLSAAERERVAANLALAQRLGAETLVVRGVRASDELLALARERNATKILVGKPGRPRWPWERRAPLVRELVDGSGRSTCSSPRASRARRRPASAGAARGTGCRTTRGPRPRSS
jgi:two-component system sensor histidine kinase KdpD